MTFPPPGTTRPVKVLWEDVQDVDNWNDDQPVQSVSMATWGMLLEETETRIVLASSYDYSNDQWANFTVIPKMVPVVEDV